MTDDNARISQLDQAFRKAFGAAPQAVIEAPGRVEIIGGHTDYNEGYVMPAAVNRSVLVAVSSGEKDVFSVHSVNFHEDASFNAAGISPSETATWCNFVRGVVVQLQKGGYQTPGLKMAIEGNIPLGSGMSSSAAIEVAVTTAILEATGQKMDGPDVARLGQRVENEFIGVNSGIMDQFISALGQEGRAMFLDCRSLAYQFAKLPADTSILVSDSKKPRTLAGSEYNVRRAQCEEAVRILKEFVPGIKALRDVSLEDLEAHSDRLPDAVRKRARHVVHENDRVLQSLRALNAGDAAKFGEMLNQSHASARDLYEISVPEMNWLQEAAVAVDGCLGSRLMGGGFGGCTVSVVRNDAVDAVRENIIKEYSAKAGREPAVMVMTASAGVRRVA